MIYSISISMHKFRNIQCLAFTLDDAHNIITNQLLERFKKIIKDPNHYRYYNIDSINDCFKLIQKSQITECIEHFNKVNNINSINSIDIYLIDSLVKSELETNKAISKLEKLFNQYYKKAVFK